MSDGTQYISADVQYVVQKLVCSTNNAIHHLAALTIGVHLVVADA